MVDQLESERRVYEYMLERFKQAGNGHMVRKLEAAPVTITAGTPAAYLKVRDWTLVCQILTDACGVRAALFRLGQAGDRIAAD
jgi:hypothetical protein